MKNYCTLCNWIFYYFFTRLFKFFFFSFVFHFVRYFLSSIFFPLLSLSSPFSPSVLSKCNPAIAAVPIADLCFVGLGLGRSQVICTDLCFVGLGLRRGLRGSRVFWICLPWVCSSISVTDWPVAVWGGGLRRSQWIEGGGKKWGERKKKLK